MGRQTAHRRLRTATAVAAATALLSLTACSDTDTRSPQTTLTSPVASSTEVVAEDLNAPWSIAFHGGTPLVSERDSGRIVELDRDGGHREVAVIDGVVASGEGGLLGIAVRDDWLYAYFTAADDNRIIRRPLIGEGGSLSLGDAQLLLDGIPKASNHNGGRIAFGPDGQLYATTGDAGDTARSQNREDLGGKILRIAPDGRIPADNPFPGSPVFSYGHRNPQGIAWSDDGTMYSSEFGQNTWDELNVIERGGNYGWPAVEGIGHRPGFLDPVQQWATADASPSGITVFDDAVYVANLRGQRLRQVPLADLGSSTETVSDRGRLRDVVRAPDGSLWVLTNNTDGRGAPTTGDDKVLRVTPAR